MTSNPGRVKISFDQLLSQSYWNYRQNPALVVPTMLQTSLQLIAQTALILPGLALLFKFLRSGLLQQIITYLTNKQYTQIPPLVETPELVSGLVAFLVVSVAALILVYIVGGGIVTAGEFGAYSEVVDGNGSADIGTVLGAMSKLWLRMVRTEAVYSLLVVVPFLLSLGVLLFSTLSLLAESSPFAGLALVIGGLISVLAGSIIAALLAFFGVFTFPAAVIEGASGLAAFRRSYHIVTSNFGLTLTYAVIRVASSAVIIAVATLANLVGVPLSSLAQTLIVFFLLPLLHLAKTSLYRHLLRGIPVSYELGPSVGQDLRRVIRSELVPLVRRGFREMVRYVVTWRNFGYHIGAVLLFVLGIFVGELLSDSGLGQILQQLGVGHGNGAIQRLSPIPLGFDLFFHNWQVALSVALSGLGFVFPTAVSMVFNGIIIGALARAVPSLSFLLAGILPHGIIELPSFFVAGSIGLKVGVYSFRAVARHRAGDDLVLRELLRKAVYVIIGLAPLFLIAGLIEATVTPAILARFH